MENDVIYLRKSRADLEAEARGEGETLARHERALIELAKRQKLNVTEIYKEIVSGETIADRPVMQKLLSEVEQGIWGGVLVMDIDRLSRGSTIDQGIVAQTFKFSDTKIITPTKTYDPNNDSDEEFFEFALFMSRREYKSITRRMQAGRAASAREGKFLGSVAPYGYKRVRLENEKGCTLEVVPGEAEIVRLIFSLYTKGEQREDGTFKRLGIQALARKLNTMGIPPIRHDYWQKETISDILKNPTYVGKIRWGYRKAKKKIINGDTVISRPITLDDNCIIAEGRHPAIVDNKTFELAEYYMSQNPPAPVGYKSDIKNPLAGIIICGKCGRKMVYRRGTNTPYYKPDYIVCHSRACDNVSAPFPLVENALLNALRKWLERHTLDVETENNNPQGYELSEKAKNRLAAEIKKLNSQLEKVHDAFEQGVYGSVQFLKRSQKLGERIDGIKAELAKQESMYANEKKRLHGISKIMPKTIHLMSVYDILPTPREKNEMLKEILEKAVYTKEKSGMYRGVSASDFELVLYPRFPAENT